MPRTFRDILDNVMRDIQGNPLGNPLVVNPYTPKITYDRTNPSKPTEQQISTRWTLPDVQDRNTLQSEAFDTFSSELHGSFEAMDSNVNTPYKPIRNVHFNKASTPESETIDIPSTDIDEIIKFMDLKTSRATDRYLLGEADDRGVIDYRGSHVPTVGMGVGQGNVSEAMAVLSHEYNTKQDIFKRNKISTDAYRGFQAHLKDRRYEADGEQYKVEHEGDTLVWKKQIEKDGEKEWVRIGDFNEIKDKLRIQ